MESVTRPIGERQQSQQSQLLLTKKPKRTVDYKIVLLGESSVGKSSILTRLQNNSFDDNKSSTIGAAFISKKIIRNETDLINLQIWDTAGQERFHNLTPLYYRNSNTAIIIFDLIHLDSFKKAEYWINELETYIGEESIQIRNDIDNNNNNNNNNNNDDSLMKIILVGNKLDLLNGKTCNFENQINEFIKKHSKIVKYFQTSAKENIQIIELFKYITDNIDDSLFHNIDEIDNSKKGLIDLNFNSTTNSSSNFCSC
ncbi:hypothetical protein C6P40_004471 [Pichia californica]|uniref:Uncharacterized protein n=1 Tax=Pichia californica TaxID=460514 RepID=A0A9P7BE69_9ASCO|nr:hypothetical protein C6P42_004210 [[Candida] californica]KAG0686329.1 hypothetical protein C6P40_004471 [[Candida] californica]